MVKIAINGFGRIGRLVFRAIVEQRLLGEAVDVVAVNDLVPADNLAYLLKYDSTHGRMTLPVEYAENAIIVNGKRIAVLSERDPTKLPWRDLHVDYVVEATGLFTHLEDAKKHLAAGAKRVVISAP